MGQYWKIVNLDKEEYIHSHNLGTGLKFAEQLYMRPGTAQALLILTVAMPRARGGGDFYGKEELPIMGSWAGDRIAMIGDYAEEGDVKACNPEAEELPLTEAEIYEACHEGEWRDVSLEVAEALELFFGGKYTGDGWKSWREN